jgi:hypothetical protein
MAAVALLGLGLVPAVAARAASSHGPVTISSNNDFITCGCVTAGDGSAGNPYVIGPYQVGSPTTGGYAVKVDNSTGQVTKSFVVRGISIGYDDQNSPDPVIWLVDVHGTRASPIAISDIDANNDGTGVELDASSYVSMDQLNINKMNGPGIVLNGASFVSISNSKLKATADGQLPHTSDGLFATNSTNINIGGVAACPKNQVCNSFDYDSGWGIYLLDSSYVNISYASANADDTGGFVLDRTSYVTLAHSTAQASGPICITVNGQRISSGYRTHPDLQGGLLLINGSSNNTVTQDAFSADVGYDLASGGNGFFANPCTNHNDPFPQPEAGAGANNIFTATCFKTTDYPGLLSNPCR